MMRGNKTKSFREENHPLRGSPRSPPKISGRHTGGEDEVRKGDLSEVFGGPLRDPLGRKYCSWRLSVLLPLIMLCLSPS